MVEEDTLKKTKRTETNGRQRLYLTDRGLGSVMLEADSMLRR